MSERKLVELSAERAKQIRALAAWLVAEGVWERAVLTLRSLADSYEDAVSIEEVEAVLNGYGNAAVLSQGRRKLRCFVESERSPER